MGIYISSILAYQKVLVRVDSFSSKGIEEQYFHYLCVHPHFLQISPPVQADLVVDLRGWAGPRVMSTMLAPRMPSLMLLLALHWNESRG